MFSNQYKAESTEKIYLPTSLLCETQDSGTEAGMGAREMGNFSPRYVFKSV